MPAPTEEMRLYFPSVVFFDQSRRDFEMVVKEMTDRCGLLSTDNLSSWRRLKQEEPKEKNQEVSITDDVDARKKKNPTHENKKSSGNVDLFSSTTQSSPLTSSSECHTTSQTTNASTSPDPPHMGTRVLEGNRKAETEIPFVLRGSFFDDSFFFFAHREFKAAMETMLRERKANRSFVDSKNIHRILRKKVNPQVVALSQDDAYHKIFMDVQDFKHGYVQAKIAGRSLVVEGRAKTEGSLSKKIFRRRFSLPAHAQSSDITAAMSSDGVLTILVKKPLTTIHENELEIPIRYVQDNISSCRRETSKELINSTAEQNQSIPKSHGKTSEEQTGTIRKEASQEVQILSGEHQHQSYLVEDRQKQNGVYKQTQSSNNENQKIQHHVATERSESMNKNTTIATPFQPRVRILTSTYLPLSIDSLRKTVRTFHDLAQEFF
ncbi:uncharacterized protein LOC143037498 isoform X2 [Oratosquilla oratoria]|uniref:uncharacterized protein LOC143037498 isoform X2 n=1 Tax=Oratosquilla oratoria TaxID=337810 RepID=UPI003F763990